ncbi:unnamed protein product, partial [Tuber aestivum]
MFLCVHQENLVKDGLSFPVLNKSSPSSPISLTCTVIVKTVWDRELRSLHFVAATWRLWLPSCNSL